MLGSRDVVRESFSRGIIGHGDEWMDMIKSRNLTSQTYNKKVADDIVHKIRTSYAPRFQELFVKLKSLVS
jgi:nucleotidyltransferase substrate binding protein (TIGR01987 family)